MPEDDDLGSAATQVGVSTQLSQPSIPSGGGVAAASVIADRYEILGLLGAGGMGRVYRVHDRTLDDTVALKLLRRDLTGSADGLERFRREVKLARRVTHTHVVRTFDLGQHGDDHFLTMEYIDGRSLAQLLDDGVLAIDEVARIARAVAGGIAAAHANGVLHRDLKPDNVLVAKTGRIAITDFGIACASEVPTATADRFAGTPTYMAPEQVERGAPIGPHTDVYAFGAILYEMLTGRRPFAGGDVIQVAVARLREPPPDARAVRAVPDALAELALRCMARDPIGRFVDGTALARAIAGLQEASATRRSEPQAHAVPAKSARSVAILPLRASGDLAELADGLGEEIVDALTMTRALRVRPLASVRKAVTADTDAREVGKALGVDVVVDGSIRKRGELVRISARAIGVADGFQLWASHFDAAPDNLLAASDDVVRAIASALTVELDMPERAARDARATALYLEGKAKLRSRWLESHLDDVIADLEQAHALAPDDGPIQATLATALARSAFYGAPAELLVRARDLAIRATEISPASGEPWFALGVAHLYGGAAPDAARALLRAVRTAPGFAMAQAMLGGLALEAGMIDEALLHLEAADSLDPGGNAHIDLPRAYYYAGRWDDARRMLEHGPKNLALQIFDAISLARLKMWRGEPHRIGVRVPPAFPHQLGEYSDIVIRIHNQNQLTPDDRARLEALIRSASRRLSATRAQFMAEFLMFAGDPDDALEYIRTSVDLGLEDALWFERCPMLDPLREREDFRQLADRVAERARAVIAAVHAGLA
jgi:serine/threonine-protein kinase